MDAISWNRTLLVHAPPSGAFLQSFEWGTFQEATGRQVRRFQTAEVVTQAVSRPMPGGFFAWDVFRGQMDDAALAELKKTAAVFMHVEPTTADHQGRHMGLPLHPSRSRQPQHTLVMDLTQTDETLLAAMHEKTRYNIRLAEKKGVTVRDATGDTDTWNRFWQIMETTAGRDGFHLHPRSYYEAMFQTLTGPLEHAEQCVARLLVAEHDGDLLAGLILIRFGNTATYLHGASADAKRNLMAPHLLQWQAMQRARAAGCTAYDFWGVAPADAANHPWAGVTRFKTGFGGTRVSLPPAWELPLRPFWYRLYRLVKRG